LLYGYPLPNSETLVLEITSNQHHKGKGVGDK
jgi:hypothetical protein